MLLIIAAVPLETKLLRHQLLSPQTVPVGPRQAFSGKINNQPLLIAHSGVGQAAMALQLTRLAENHPLSSVLLCGCGGCYPGSGLKIGDLALANEEIYGDLGVATASRFIPLDQLDIPQDPSLMPPLQQSYPLQSQLGDWARSILPEAVCGPFVTVNCGSGQQLLSEELEQRTGGICENMEGAAAAQVCAEYHLPLLELRGISNPTGTHNPQQWDIVKGAETAQLAVLELLTHWPEQ